MEKSKETAKQKVKLSLKKENLRLLETNEMEVLDSVVGGTRPDTAPAPIDDIS